MNPFRQSPAESLNPDSIKTRIKEAPGDALFICKNQSDVEALIPLAGNLGRTDIRFESLAFLSSKPAEWREKYAGRIIFDCRINGRI